MKTLTTSILFLAFSTFCYTQSYLSLVENETLEFNEFDISYNTQKIKTKKKQDVYEVRVSIRNRGFDKIILKNKIGESEWDKNQYRLANITFKNATGTALTVRDGIILGDEIKQTIHFKCQDCTDGEKKVEKTSKTTIAYGLLKGASLNKEFRIRVPEGEKPQVEIQIVNYY